MSRWLALALFTLLAGAAAACRAEEIVIDFEQAEIGKPLPAWTEKGVLFNLAAPLTTSNAKGRIMFFMSHKSDFGDGYEREGDDPSYFYKFSVPGYAVGIDIVLTP